MTGLPEFLVWIQISPDLCSASVELWYLWLLQLALASGTFHFILVFLDLRLFLCWTLFLSLKLSAYFTFPSLLGNSSHCVWKPSYEFSCHCLGFQVLQVLILYFKHIPDLPCAYILRLLIPVHLTDEFLSFWDLLFEIENLNCRFTWVVLQFNLNQINHKG